MPDPTPLSTEQLLEEWRTLPLDERVRAFKVLSRDEVDEFFQNLSARDQAELLAELVPADQRFWIRSLAPDDAADLIQEAGEDLHATWLHYLDPVRRSEVTALLAYREDAAGGLMSPHFARLRPTMSVDAAISYLRRQSATLESIYYAYVLDSDQRLLGVVAFRDLFVADRSKTVQELMRTSFLAASEDMDQEAVARLVTDNHLLALPVLDRHGRMKGIVTVDDIVDVVREEADEDLQKLGGQEALDAPYLQTSFAELFRKRAGWLSVLFIGEMLTASAMSRYEDEIQRAVVLSLFVPLIISSGGNSGSQATSLIIQSMASGELRMRDWSRVARRELMSGLALGSVLALLGFTRIVLWHQLGLNFYTDHWLRVAFVVSLSLIGVVLFGTIVGSMLPFLLRTMRLDPASASAPAVATLVDVTGLVIYFTVAEVILRGTLL